MGLIQRKLDLADPEKFKQAEKAINDILRDEMEEGGENSMTDFGAGGGADDTYGVDRKVWLEKKHSRSYLLIKLQRAFCMRQLYYGSQENRGISNEKSLAFAVDVLLSMDIRTGYPQMLG